MEDTLGQRGKRLVHSAALPGWLIVGLELAERFHLAASIVEHAPWLATPNGRLLILIFGLAWLFVVVLWPAKGRPNSQEPVPTGTLPSELLRTQARQIASVRLDELFERGKYLSNNTPPANDSSDAFSRFWNEQVQQWVAAVTGVLRQGWAKQDEEFFLSLAGENPAQFALGVHPRSAASYRSLLRHVKNLDSLRQSLSRI